MIISAEAPISRSREAERGFVLIAAMWLLILGGAIAALLMLRAIDAARDVRAVSDGLVNASLPDDALVTVAANILFAGPAGNWARLPSQGALDLGGRSVDVALRAESQLPDVNRVDLAVLDGLLHDRGYAPEQRTAILARIAEARAEHRLFGSFAAVAALGRGVVLPGRETCLDGVLSPFGGTAAQASGQAFSTPGEAAPIRPGDVIRLSMSIAGPRRIYAMRFTAANDQPYGLLDWYDDDCGGSFAA